MSTPEDTLGQRLRQARETAGFTLEDVAYLARRHLPGPLRFSRAKLQRVEADGEEGKVDPYMVQFLASTYSRDLAELSPAAAEQLSAFAAVIEQGFHGFGCIDGNADQLVAVA